MSGIEWKSIRPRSGELHAIGETAGTLASIEISLNGRPTANVMEIVGSNGTIYLDLFHGYSFVQPGTVSRARKIFKPFDLASRQLAAASVNMGRRILRQEAAYPGLRRLINSFYVAIETESTPPISPATALDVASARDKLLHTTSRREAFIPGLAFSNETTKK